MLSSRRARALTVALLAAVLGALLPATAAQAEGRTVQGGRLDWGIKSSFQSYVTGPVANGSWSLTGGAATVGGSQFRFHSATGSYDPATGAFSSAFAGGVHFLGHRKSDGSHELDLTISRPTVRIAGGSGTLYADVVGKDRGTGRVTSAARVPLATLGLSGIDMKGGSTPIALRDVPATLTAQGAKSFAGYYTAGTPLDPVSLSVDTSAPAGKPAATESPGKKKEAKKAGPAAGRFEDAAVDWGVRRTFREYVTGSIGKGKWTLAEGAQDGGALFRFPKGKGTYDPKKQTLDAGFAGSVHFTGADGLDLELSAVKVRLAAGRGTLLADVHSDGDRDRAVPLVTFTAKDFAPKDGLAVLTEAPATLTAEGAEAFGSLYRAGTAMDPVSLAVAVDAGAELPALPDLGSDPGPSSGPSAPATEKPAPATAASDTGTGTVLYPVLGGAALLVAAAVAFGLVRRRAARQNND
ncbi:HtaA domain-containing protein [Streptomyces sp. NBC_00264]|uniref:HtaA domain-containing protein n=1 Tax=unclassified Streptomyces TaxID=2593676 RepID=UPI00224DF0FF|nr:MULTISPECIES: HtaA domain-containing protein [unclassified Streptomyces]MCX4397025.1 HtaA domain-containing protein [Streptomyces sp. NBC_01767]MCX5159824.1 HtaA domain-containing protein [Streptomyces sp. NBC_00305]MCX5218347.1 HtaA domain-containing protein [Streptomyces sp. NBC_00264]